MKPTRSTPDPGRLFVLVRGACWAGLFLIAVMAAASFGLMQNVLSGLRYGQSEAALRQVIVGDMMLFHQLLFLATMIVIAGVAIFVFLPLMRIVRRRTMELADAHETMERMAIRDPLTGLYNRNFLRDHLDALLRVADRRRERLALVQFDLDRFKQINDTLGHAAGDVVLIEIAERLRASCRASDISARLGGDEFVLVLPAPGQSSDIDALVRRIMARINEPIDFQSNTIMPGASAGIAVYPVDARSQEDLLVHADLALYAAKRRGGDGFNFFSGELRKELEQRMALEGELRAAIARGDLEVFFQPQISLVDGAVLGVEALARWPHPERGMVPPSEFIPVAEKSGLMPRLGHIVMRKAIRHAGQWHRDGIGFGRLCLNLSAAELAETDLPDTLRGMLHEAGLPPDRIALEIVEPILLEGDAKVVGERLKALRDLGVHLELANFGAGYASLAHVNRNGITRLKIDHGFVTGMTDGDEKATIVRAITEMARGLGIDSLAAGVETEAELDMLREMGCEQVQGYSIAYPMPQEQTRTWLSVRGPRRPALAVHEGGLQA